MSDQRKRGRGRPPLSPTGPQKFHLGMRFPDERRDQLLALVRAANDRAKAAGLPQNVTPSGLATLWVFERLDVEMSKLKKRPG